MRSACGPRGPDAAREHGDAAAQPDHVAVRSHDAGPVGRVVEALPRYGGHELPGHAEEQGQRSGGRAGALEQHGVVEERPAEPLGQQPTDGRRAGPREADEQHPHRTCDGTNGGLTTFI